MAEGRVYHLWRECDTAPFQRWACDVSPDEGTPDGFRVVAFDAAVADPGFLDGMAAHMRRPHLVQRSGQVPAGEEGVVDETLVAKPGDPGHFGEAIRTVPGAVLGSEGRAA